LFTDIWVRPVGGSPTRNRCGRRCWEYIRWTPPGHSDVMVRADGARYKTGTGALGHVRVGGRTACGTRTSTRAGCKRGRRSCSGRRKVASIRRTRRAWSTTRPVSDQQQGKAVQAIGDDQLERHSRISAPVTISSRRVSSRNPSRRPRPRSYPIAATMTPQISDIAITASRLMGRDSTPFPPRRRSDRSGYAAGPWPGWPARHAGADTPVGDTP